MRAPYPRPHILFAILSIVTTVYVASQLGHYFANQRTQPVASEPAAAPIVKTDFDAELEKQREEMRNSPLVKLSERIRPKMGPEYLDELIERANTPQSREITIAKLWERPDSYYGQPWWFTGKLIHIKQLKNVGCNITVEPVGADNFHRIQVFGDEQIDFARFEEVDVIGYIVDKNTILAHSILKKGSVAKRWKYLQRKNQEDETDDE